MYCKIPVLLQSPAEADQTAVFPDESLHHLPIMPLSKVKLPQETISLQLFEPRYRLLFKLVKQASSRRFGLVLADQQQGTIESFGSLCELTHYIPVPERSVMHAAEEMRAEAHAARFFFGQLLWV